MLGDSTVLGTGGGSSGDAPSNTAAVVVATTAVTNGASPDAEAIDGGGGGGDYGGSSNSGDDERGRGEEGERSFGGNRWPRQETLALLKIRSDMDVAFRDASVKGPLWEEVSRKLAELGYHRNAKKCKEKFENVYKYHRRTKEGRSGKSDGKTYRFFDQLEALEHNPSAVQSPRTSQTAPLSATPVSIVKTTASLPQQQVMMMRSTNSTTSVPPQPHITTTIPISMPQTQTNLLNIPTMRIPSSYPQQTNPTLNLPTTNLITTPSFPSIPTELLSNLSSSSTSSDETIEGRRKRKRKWKDFFERLMKEVVEKQEELQRRFLEAIEKREQERVAREESWRVQELQRINREREILAQERSIAAAKDQAVMSFLQKIAEQQNLGTTLNNISITPQTTPTPTPIATPTPKPAPVVQQQKQAQVTSTEAALVVPLAKQKTHDMQPQQQQQQVITNMEIVKADNNNNGENLMAPSSSRWPKAEVEALINLRTSLDIKYQENGPKGPLWEDISSLMKKIGYNRSAKRCKEKWENINKYFKKVKESNKKRPEDSKTCPYFHQLDALYRERNKQEGDGAVKPNETMMAPLMVQPEQQWPPQQTVQPPYDNADKESSLPADQQQHEEEEDGDDGEGREMGEEDQDDEDDNDDDDEGGDNYEIVASKPASVGASAD